VLEDADIAWRHFAENRVNGLVRFEEMCWKLTLDAAVVLDVAVVGAKHRQRLAIGQDADIA